MVARSLWCDAGYRRPRLQPKVAERLRDAVAAAPIQNIGSGAQSTGGTTSVGIATLRSGWRGAARCFAALTRRSSGQERRNVTRVLARLPDDNRCVVVGRCGGQIN